MNLGMCIKGHGHNSDHFQAKKHILCECESVTHNLQKMFSFNKTFVYILILLQ
jgi:hypothetical protein